MDFVLEILFEIILEGCIEITEEKNVPLIFRILCAVILVLVYGGMVGILLYVGISNKSLLLLFIAVFVASIIPIALVYKFKIRKKNKLK